MARIIVTGGTGYIGSHTCVELIKENHEVIVIDNLSNSSENVLNSIASISGTKPIFYNVDLADPEATKAVFAGLDNVDGIIHFAALKSVGESVDNPLDYYNNNLNSLMNVLREMKNNSIPNIIFSSSCTVYGLPDNLPVNESTPVKPANSPYGNTKQIAESILKDYCHAEDFVSVVSLRYFNPIGAHASAEIGELPIGAPNNLMPYITQTAAGIREELQVFGDDYATPDGTGIRDYIHVVDLAKAHIKAFDRQLAKAMSSSYEVFNVGTGRGYSVMEVIQSFEKTSNEKLKYKIVGRRAGDIAEIYADPSKANDVLGWKATHDLDDMTSSAWKWEKSLRKNS